MMNCGINYPYIKLDLTVGIVHVANALFMYHHNSSHQLKTHLDYMCLDLEFLPDDLDFQLLLPVRQLVAVDSVGGS